MKVLIKVLGGLVAVGGSVLTLWLAFTNITLAYLAIVAMGVLSIGGIVWLAYLTMCDPMAAVRKANASMVVDETAAAAPSRAGRRL